MLGRLIVLLTSLLLLVAALPVPNYELHEHDMAKREPMLEPIPIESSYDSIRRNTASEQGDDEEGVTAHKTRNVKRPNGNSGRNVKRPIGNSGRSVVDDLKRRKVKRPGGNSGRSVADDLEERMVKRPGGNSGRSVADDLEERKVKRPGGNSGRSPVKRPSGNSG